MMWCNIAVVLASDAVQDAVLASVAVSDALLVNDAVQEQCSGSCHSCTDRSLNVLVAFVFASNSARLRAFGEIGDHERKEH